MRDRQIVGLNPGRTCRAIEFAKMLRDRSCQADVTIAGASWIASSAWHASCIELIIGAVAAPRISRGIQKLSVSELTRYVNEGVRDWQAT